MLILLSMSITHHSTILVYRFTEMLAEEYLWKPQEAAAAAFLKWSAIILLPIVGVLILMDPPLVIAGIGPLGMGLMAGMMGAKIGIPFIGFLMLVFIMPVLGVGIMWIIGKDIARILRRDCWAL